MTHSDFFSHTILTCHFLMWRVFGLNWYIAPIKDNVSFGTGWNPYNIKKERRKGSFLKRRLWSGLHQRAAANKKQQINKGFTGPEPGSAAPPSIIFWGLFFWIQLSMFTSKVPFLFLFSYTVLENVQSYYEIKINLIICILYTYIMHHNKSYWIKILLWLNRRDWIYM